MKTNTSVIKETVRNPSVALPSLPPPSSHLYPLAVDLYRTEHEIDTYRIAVALNVDPVFEPLHHASLAHAGVPNQNDFEEEMVRVVHSAKVY